jgi:hypothetical protein
LACVSPYDAPEKTAHYSSIFALLISKYFAIAVSFLGQGQGSGLPEKRYGTSRRVTPCPNHTQTRGVSPLLRSFSGLPNINAVFWGTADENSASDL